MRDGNVVIHKRIWEAVNNAFQEDENKMAGLDDAVEQAYYRMRQAIEQQQKVQAYLDKTLTEEQKNAMPNFDIIEMPWRVRNHMEEKKRGS